MDYDPAPPYQQFEPPSNDQVHLPQTQSIQISQQQAYPGVQHTQLGTAGVLPQTVVIRVVTQQPKIIENYDAKRSKILGIVQLVAGGIAFIMSLVGLVLQFVKFEISNWAYIVCAGLWCFVLIALSGSFAVCAARKKRGLIIAHMVLAMVASVFAFVMLCMSVTALGIDSTGGYYMYYGNYDTPRGAIALSGLWTISSLAVFVACVWSSTLGCRVLCYTSGSYQNETPVVVMGTSGHIVQGVQIPATGAQAAMGHANLAVVKARMKRRDGNALEGNPQ